MATCCGGKNAGKRISKPRYLAGLGVFLGYHGAMRVLLSTASVPFPKLKKVRDFHKQVFETDLKEILALEDINLDGRLETGPDASCEVTFDDVPTVQVSPEDFIDVAEPIPIARAAS